MLKRSARLLRCLVAQGRVRSDRVVVITPEGQLSPRIFQTVEYLLVQQLVPEAAIKAFNERILLRFSWIDVMPRHGVLVGPSQDGPTGELGPKTPLE